MDGDEQSWILFMGTFPPRECGIATFTKDLADAVDSRLSPLIKSKILAMNRNGVNIYNYPEDVLYHINDADIQEYIDAAKKINEDDRIKLINIQHEFGIFGGEYGSYLIAFLEIVKKPVIVTLHSILPDPDDNLKRVVQAIAKKTESIVVMTNIAKDILKNAYSIKTRIEVIPHGIPSIPLEHNAEQKAKLGFGDKTILLSFGMVNPGKGYEYAISALPAIIKKYPDILYLIVGETHPVVRREYGEKYRNFLEKKIKKLGLEKHVKFYNRYVSIGEIKQYLQAADIFICSNTDQSQVTSGTLAYAAGAGKAIVSTPFLHAKELITENTGVFAEFNSSKSLGGAIIKLLSDKELKKKIEHEIYANTRHMTWGNVALAYSGMFRKYLDIEKWCEAKMPQIKLDHLINLTDDFGLIQFAKNTKPDPMSGYTLDDNARAAIVCAMHYDMHKDGSSLLLLKKYVDLIKHTQNESGKFCNFIDCSKKVLSEWHEDSHGRALWSLGHIINTPSIPDELKNEAEQLFKKGLAAASSLNFPRAVAFSILGLCFYNNAKPGFENLELIKALGNKLVSLYEKHSSDKWSWFEERVTYSNSKLPESLFYAYTAVKDERYLETAKKSLDFLRSITMEKDMFSPIGQNGWYMKNGKRAYFDQQPEDAASMVQTLLVAHWITQNKNYLGDALNVFSWFLGKNCLRQNIYDEATGGCYDGLGEFTVNLNQGAESTVSYLLARLSLCGAGSEAKI